MGSFDKFLSFACKFFGRKEQWVFANLDVHSLHCLAYLFEHVLVLLAVVGHIFAVLLLDWLEDLVLGLLSS